MYPAFYWAAVALGRILVAAIGRNVAQVEFRALVASFGAWFYYQVTAPEPKRFVPHSAEELQAFLAEIGPWIKEQAVHARVESGVVEYFATGGRLVFSATSPAGARVHLYIPLKNGTAKQAKKILSRPPLGCSLTGSKNYYQYQACLAQPLDTTSVARELMPLIDSSQQSEFLADGVPAATPR